MRIKTSHGKQHFIWFCFQLLVICSLVFSTVTPAIAQDGATPEAPTENPTQVVTGDATLESTPEPTLEVTETPTLEPLVSPTTEITPTEPEGVHLLGTPPANDNIANATVISSLPYSLFGQSIADRSTEAGEPRNTCNATDTGSVWFSFTPGTTGIYQIYANGPSGMSYYPKMSVYQVVDASTRNQVVCGNKDTFTNYLSFFAAAGTTYLIGISDSNAAYTGNLDFSLVNIPCTIGNICAVAVGGDGTAIPNPRVRLYNTNSQNYFYSKYVSNNYGYFDLPATAASTSTISVVVTGSNNLIVAANVAKTGVFNISGIGLPQNTLFIKGTSGENLAADVSIIPTSFRYIDMTSTSDSDGTFKFYGSAGNYNITAMSVSNKLLIYQPNLTLTSSPASLTVNAASLPKDRITFNQNLPAGSTASFSATSPDYTGFNTSITVSSSETMTLAAPIGTHFPWLFINVLMTDPITNLTWNYAINTGDHDLIGENLSSRNVGGTFKYTPTLSSTSFYPGQGGSIYSNATDAYGNSMNQIYYYGEAGSAGVESNELKNENYSTTIIKTTDGVEYPIREPILTDPEVIGQAWVWANAYVNYSIKDFAGNSIPVTIPGSPYLSTTFPFTVPANPTIGTATVTGTMDYGPYQPDSIKTTTFTVKPTAPPPANDNIANAKVISTVPYSTSQSTTGATLETNEPENVCNQYDTGSVWYKFKPTSSGIYKANVFGSDYNSEWNRALGISVLKMVDSTTFSPVVCGDTRYPQYYDYESTLSFSAIANTTYLIGFSSDKSGTLKLKLEKRTCPSGHLCSTSVGADGRAIDGNINLIDLSGNFLENINSNSDNGGFSDIYSWNGALSGIYTAITYGSNNVIVTPNVTAPGIFTASGAGLIKTPITFNDSSGNPIPWAAIYLARSDYPDSYGGYLGEINDGAFDLYAPAGTYDFTVVDWQDSILSYYPEIVLVPGEAKTLSAASYAKDTITYSFNSENAQICPRIHNMGYCLDVESGNPLTLIAPAGTEFVDTDGTLYFGSLYGSNGSSLRIEIGGHTIIGGNSSAVTLGNNLTITPRLSGLPYRKDEKTGMIGTDIKDSEGHRIWSGRTYSYSASSASVEAAPKYVTWQDPVTLKFMTGPEEARPLISNEASSDVTDQAYSAIDYLPTFTVKDPLGVTHPISGKIYNWLGNTYPFSLVTTSTLSTWHATAAINMGPFTPGTITGTTDFSVIGMGTAPANDLIANAAVIDNSSLPFTVTDLDTMGATSVSGDPYLPCTYNSKGNASVWYKFVPAQDGVYSLDTAGSSYNTLLAVWTGTPTSLKNIGCNDYTETTMTAALNFDAKAGTTYYIEAAQPQASDFSMQSIGGTLDLVLDLVTPCYTLNTSLNFPLGGTITRSLSGNCLVSEYKEETEIYLTVTPKTGYTFVNWNGDNITNPTAVTIASNQAYVANLAVKPGIPTLLLPASSALTQFASTVLTWKVTSPAADRYQLQVSIDKNFGSFVVNDSTIKLLTFTPATLAPNTVYYWRVRGLSLIDQEGTWSAVRSFRTAILPPADLLPVEGSSERSRTPVFSWTGFPGSTSYTLQVSKTANFSSLVLNTTSLTTTFNTTSMLPIPTSTYPLLYWRVQAKGVNGPSLWSEVRTLTIPNTPLAPNLLLPANAALSMTYTPRFDWADSVVPAGANLVATYDFQLGTDKTFAVDTSTSSVSVSEVPVSETLAANTTYYWRVRAVDTAGNFSPWSVVRSLRTVITTPILSVPADASNEHSRVPTFTWGSVAGSSGYTLQVSKTANFSSLVLNTTSLTTTFNTTSMLPIPTSTYPLLYWRVQAKGVNGPSLWSEVRTLTIPNTPLAPNLLLPANAALSMTYTPRFDWADSVVPAGANLVATYDFQLGTDKTFAVDTSTSSVSVSEVPVSETLAANTTYYWRARAVDTADNFSPWSVVRSIRTVITTPILSAPADNSRSLLMRPAFDWQDVTGATGYTIQISKNLTFTSIVTNTTAVKSTYTPASDLPANIPLYWRVQAKAANGPSNWSTVWKVTPVQTIGGTWAETTSMAKARWRPTSTLLPNGNVLIVGGLAADSSAEVFDPTNATWADTGAMSASRTLHTATLLNNGKVLVTGGNIDGVTNAVASAELYDPASNTWTATGSMEMGRARHSATLLPDGKVLVAGGSTGNIINAFSSAELYDPETGIWTTINPLHTARVDHTATLLPNGKVLIVGGNNQYAIASTELFDPATGNWTNTGSMVTSRVWHTATLLLNGKVMVCGGHVGLGGNPLSVELYDPATGKWTSTSPLAIGRNSHTATLLTNGNVMITGGSVWLGPVLSSSQIYYPSTGKWGTANSMNVARAAHTAIALPDGTVLVAGGVGLTSAEIYSLVLAIP